MDAGFAWSHFPGDALFRFRVNAKRPPAIGTETPEQEQQGRCHLRLQIMHIQHLDAHPHEDGVEQHAYSGNDSKLCHTLAVALAAAEGEMIVQGVVDSCAKERAGDRSNHRIHIESLNERNQKAVMSDRRDNAHSEKMDELPEKFKHLHVPHLLGTRHIAQPLGNQELRPCLDFVEDLCEVRTHDPDTEQIG